MITSGVTLVDSPQAAAEGALASSSVDTGADAAGVVTVGVRKAAGAKCARCWGYSVQVRRGGGGCCYAVCARSWQLEPVAAALLLQEMIACVQPPAVCSRHNS